MDKLTDEEKRLQRYYAREKALMDEISRANYPEHRYREGIEIGREIGRQKVRQEIIKNFLVLGADIELIKKATNLTDEEIDKIKQDIEKDEKLI